MRPVILIIEPRSEIASALEEVITSANYSAMVIPHLECLADLVEVPAAIIVRIAFEGLVPAHAAIEKLPPKHPPVLAIARDDAETAEAVRLKCDIVLGPPRGVSRLCEALKQVVHVTDPGSGIRDAGSGAYAD